MRLCFLINPSENWRQSVQHTRLLASSAAKQHEVSGVFFYGQAAHIIQDNQEQSKWTETSDYPLYICRTMIDSFDLAENSSPIDFKIVGMATWIIIMENADRIVEIV